MICIKCASEYCLTPNEQFFSYIMARPSFIFDEMMMMSLMKSTLFYTNVLSWIFIVLSHWNNSQRVDMSLNLDTLFWFRANQSLSYSYQFHSLLFDPTGSNTDRCWLNLTTKLTIGTWFILTLDNFLVCSNQTRLTFKLNLNFQQTKLNK